MVCCNQEWYAMNKSGCTLLAFLFVIKNNPRCCTLSNEFPYLGVGPHQPGAKYQRFDFLAQSVSNIFVSATFCQLKRRTPEI